MEGKVDSDTLMRLMDLDFTFDNKTNDMYSLDKCQRLADDIINANDILEENFFGLNKKWSKIAILLNKGYFGLLKRYKDEFISLRMPRLVGT